MKNWIRRFSSLKIAIGLLVFIVVALAAGTLVESARGSAAAAEAVYHAFWFRLLLGLFAVNLACSLWEHWPWGWQRTGFALTHGSLLVILAGALVTDRLKVEGQLALWEGEEGSLFVEEPASGSSGLPATHTLPFSVRLQAFEIDTYPGTDRPAMFRSRVLVNDPVAHRSFPAVIQMNHELSYAGYRLFQTSFQRTPERDQTVLTVSRDPGQGIVFSGYLLLMLGMMTVLGTRIAQRRALLRLPALRQASAVRRVAVWALGLSLVAGVGSLSAGTARVPDPATVEKLRLLPVQHDGRVMPLDTLAREATWKVTGKRQWFGTDPTALVLGWALYPDGWAVEPVFPLGSGDLATAIGLPAATGRASFLELVRNPRLMELIGQARADAEQERPVGGLLREAQRMEERLTWMQEFLKGTILRVTPSSGEPGGVWSAPSDLRNISALLFALNTRPASSALMRAMRTEAAYNRIRPTRLAWWILAGATAASLLAWNLRRRWADALAGGGLVAGFAVMTWGLGVRWQVAGRIPASNMYESLLFLAWGVAIFALVAVIFLRSRLVILNATAMSALTMALADQLPLDPFVHPVPPVLADTAWLAIHVPIIMVSYAVLALGVLVAHMQIGFEIFAPARTDLAAKMNDLLYWYVHIGSILLIAGILTGSIWAASSWGRYWGWDPKEVWSLIAFLAYLAILHGRLEKILGSFGVAAVSIVAFWTILMTYVGVNYVLASGLHSYGFGGSGVVRWMLAVGGAEALFLGAGFFVHLARHRGLRPTVVAS